MDCEMRKLCFKAGLAGLMLVTLTACVSYAQAQSKRSSRTRAARPADSTLLEIVRQWNQALQQGDRVTLANLVDDTFVFTDAQGKIYDKTKYLDLLLGDTVRVQSYELDELAVHTSGAVAIVTGRWSGKLA